MSTMIQIPVAVALIRDSNGTILLQRRLDESIPDADGKWELPGGKVNIGEDPQDAIIRECKEEINCEIRIVRLLPRIFSNVWKRTDGVTAQVLVMCYEATIIKGKPTPTDKKVAAVAWFLPEETMALQLLPGTQEFIDLL